ncbi:hypothetical protein NDU88_006177 [Pleurodeles waltl]|uniref:Uncharacterized protein n=1 Tax=Pleurodeles waltl TaxID=8319 RepID=A0AAV7VNW3_PLEWA|nr:hypothetical protein NDU88_006177 [Pleurodeles waltl]
MRFARYGRSGRSSDFALWRCAYQCRRPLLGARFAAVKLILQPIGLEQVDPSCREEKTATASSDPEEQEAMPNPFSLPGIEGQASRCAPFSGVKRRTLGWIVVTAENQARKWRREELPTAIEEKEASW